MNVYDAIMKAAEHIESHPNEFDFLRFCIPACGSPGCALGWIGCFAGIPADMCGATTMVPYKVLGFDQSECMADAKFYRRLHELVGTEKWKTSASLCAKALRLYAAKYHTPSIPKRTDAELVAALMARVTSGERIPEDA